MTTPGLEARDWWDNEMQRARREGKRKIPATKKEVLD